MWTFWNLYWTQQFYTSSLTWFSINAHFILLSQLSLDKGKVTSWTGYLLITNAHTTLLPLAPTPMDNLVFLFHFTCFCPLLREECSDLEPPQTHTTWKFLVVKCLFINYCLIIINTTKLCQCFFVELKKTLFFFLFSL